MGATGYANPQLDELIEKIESALITYGRDALFEQAWQIMRDDVVVIPFFRLSAVWAMREELDLPIGPDLMPYFYDAQLK